MIIYEGLCYVISIQEQGGQEIYNLFVQPFDLLRDLDRIIYSDTHEHYLAMRLRDIRKVAGQRDHLIFETCDRELLADFVMDYADKKANMAPEKGGLPDAEIIFE